MKPNTLYSKYDSTYKPTKQDIEKFPDLQNGPSSLIQGANVEIQQVGIHNFKLPLKFKTKDESTIELETKVTGTVSLDAHKKGINMSRIMRSFYDYKHDVFDFDLLEKILLSYKENLSSFNAKILLKFSYPIIQTSLRSDLDGYQYYDVNMCAELNKNGNFRKIFH